MRTKATVPNYKDFGGWVGRTKQRPVCADVLWHVVTCRSWWLKPVCATGTRCTQPTDQLPLAQHPALLALAKPLKPRCWIPRAWNSQDISWVSVVTRCHWWMIQGLVLRYFTTHWRFAGSLIFLGAGIHGVWLIMWVCLKLGFCKFDGLSQCS